MPLTVARPSCKAYLAAQEKSIGREVRCPRCHGIFVVPDPEPIGLARHSAEPIRSPCQIIPAPNTQESLTDRAPPAVIPISCPNCGWKGSAPESFRGRELRCSGCGKSFPVGRLPRRPGTSGLPRNRAYTGARGFFTRPLPAGLVFVVLLFPVAALIVAFLFAGAAQPGFFLRAAPMLALAVLLALARSRRS